MTQKGTWQKVLQGSDRALGKLLPVPFCFMGMGIFRVWTETLYANHEWTFPAQTLNLPLPSFDAYSVFDITAAVILIVMALLSRWIAPLYKHPSAIIATGITMVACACLNFVSIIHPEYASMLRWPALLCGGAGIALILMLWSEFFGCINPLRVALYYSASIAVGACILWLFKGLSFYWLWAGTCIIPLLSLFCLWRAYATLPAASYPPAYLGDFSFPWKPVLVVCIYSFVYGLRSSIFSGVLAMNSGLGAFVGSIGIYLAISLMRESFEFSSIWKIAVPLMIASLLPIDLVLPFWAEVAKFCALASYTMLLILIMAILSNLSYRYGVCALWIFAIERAGRLIASQTGRITGIEIDRLNIMPDLHILIVIIMAALLVFVAFFFFSEKQISSPWGVILQRPLGEDTEFYLAKTHLGTKCHELAKSKGLTGREEEVLLLIARGKHQSEICQELYIGKNTFKTHAKHIYQKLGIHSRSELFEILGVQ